MIRASVLAEASRLAVAPHGLAPAHVEYVVDTLLSTSLSGIDSHGLRLLPTYVEELRGGRSNPRPAFEVESGLPALAVLRADDALGVVAGNVAIEMAAERAREFGIAAVAVKDSNHFGAAGHYTARAAKLGMVAFAFSNSDALVSPENGTMALNGTNPLSMAAPGLDDDLFWLDMATSQISYSRVRECIDAGLPIPAGWAKDELGADASQTRRVHTLTPLGGYKGQGLGMMIQILSAIACGMPFDNVLSHLYVPPYDQPRKIGHFFICIDIRALGEPETFRRRVTQLLEAFRASPHDGTPVIAPGDKERAIRAARLRDGIPLDAKEWAFFQSFVEGIS